MLTACDDVVVVVVVVDPRVHDLTIGMMTAMMNQSSLVVHT